MSDTLNLLYGFAPPAVVYITEDSSKPVNNTLTFDIGNPSGSALVKMENPDKLGPDSNIPNYGSQDPQVNLSRFYIWFPYAKNAADAQPQDIATLSDAANIDVGPGPINTSWNVVKKTSSSIGTYWTLFPKESTVLDPQQSVAFLISNLVSQTPSGSMSWMYVQAVDVPGYEESTHEVQLFKELPKLAITAFDLSPQLVEKGGTTTITWSTVNADYVIATPAIDPQDPGKRYPANNLSPGITITPAVGIDQYFLTAYNEQGEHVTSQPVNLSVLPPEISYFKANMPETMVNGIVMLSWSAENVKEVQINPKLWDEMPVEGQGLLLVKEDITLELTATNEYGFSVSQPLNIVVGNITPSITDEINVTGQPFSSPAPNGQNGADGGNGTVGANGADGLPGPVATLNPGTVAEDTCLKLIVSGGAGQDAGNGGNGGNSDSGPGGAGGNGGTGGNGGDGATLTLVFDNAPPKLMMALLDGAPGGSKGLGGTGGAGNPRGMNGINGQDGNPGTPGTLIFKGYLFCSGI